MSHLVLKYLLPSLIIINSLAILDMYHSDKNKNTTEDLDRLASIAAA